MAREARHRPLSSSRRLSLPQSPLTRIPDPNIFSDEYALDPLDASASSSPVSPIPRSEHEPPVDTFSTPRASTENDGPLLDAPSIPNRPNSTLKRPREALNSTPRRSISAASTADSATHRMSSTSSRVSIPRSQSPYVGASGPSHPYAMYPQVTRASSTASASTVRPTERAFIAPAGPEHPYSMYPQNTVPEEDDVQFPPMSIPLGFPGFGQAYQQRSRSAGDDIADIVGADGHIEELPPYSRYPEHGVPKDSAPQLDTTVNGQPTNGADAPTSPQPTSSPFSDSHVVLNMAAARTAGSDSDGSFKERWKEKTKRRVLCGLPLWCLLVLIAVMVVVGAVGGAIGAILAKKQADKNVTGAPPDRSNSTASTAATVTVTSWIDATPLPDSSSPANLPTGQYNLPTDEINLNSSSCVVDNALSAAWGCMPSGGLWIDIEPLGPCFSATFEPFPINANFTYGPQPPNLNGVVQPLSPFMDKDASSLGPALFFFSLYDKLTILPAEALNNYTPSKRSLSVTDIAARSPAQGQTGQVGDRPWFCWFNQTILEFFIYLEHNTSATSASTFSPSSTSLPRNGVETSTFLAGLYPSSPTSGDASSQPTWPPQDRRRASSYRRDGGSWRDPIYTTDYPLWIKLEEKRKPNNNIQPYCQQMRVLETQMIVPQEGVPIINVSEIEPSRSGHSKRTDMDGSTTSLGSNCVCEWLATT